MVNYMSKFIPNLADLTQPFRGLLKKYVEWHWSERQENAFQAINPLRRSIKLQILLLCFHTFITDVKGRSCSNINRISFE